VLRLLSADFLRIRRYWLTWALLVVLILILSLQINSKLSQLEDLKNQIQLAIDDPNSEELGVIPLEANQFMFDHLQQDLIYPNFIGTVARTSTDAGWFLIILFTAVMGGEDFSRRTLSNILTRGIERAQYLVGRCLSLWLVAGLGVLILVVLASAVGPFIHRHVTSDPITFRGFGDTLMVIVRTWVTYLPFIIATLFWAVLARNAGPAMGVGIGLHTFELLNGFAIPFIAVVFGNLSGSEVPWFYKVQIRLFSYTLGYNADVFLNWGAPFSRDPIFVASTLGLSDASLLPSTPTRSGIILVIYVILFLVWMMRILQHRDISYET
jgi:ABC-type transport system involved in multi-copper enzyme maturation permease subunit